MAKAVWWQKTALVLAAIGAINWGLTELGFNLVNLILGSVGWLEALVYYLVGLSGIYALIEAFK